MTYFIATPILITPITHLMFLHVYNIPILVGIYPIILVYLIDFRQLYKIMICM